jgi:hypothetical protein
VTGTNLDKIDRIKIDLKTGAVEKMYAQQATYHVRDRGSGHHSRRPLCLVGHFNFNAVGCDADDYSGP